MKTLFDGTLRRRANAFLMVFPLIKWSRSDTSASGEEGVGKCTGFVTPLISIFIAHKIWQIVWLLPCFIHLLHSSRTLCHFIFTLTSPPSAIRHSPRTRHFLSNNWLLWKSEVQRSAQYTYTVVVSSVRGQEEFCQYLPVTNRLFDQKRYFMLIINATHLAFVEPGIDNHSGLFTWKLNTHIFGSPPALFKYIVYSRRMLRCRFDIESELKVTKTVHSNALHLIAMEIAWRWTSLYDVYWIHHRSNRESGGRKSMRVSHFSID